MRIITHYVNSIETYHLSLLMFPDILDQIMEDIYECEGKYLDAMNRYIALYEKEKITNTVISLTYTRYYKQMKEFKNSGYKLPPKGSS